MNFFHKPHDDGQTSSYFSTLSPLAPPFTTVRSQPSFNDPGLSSPDPAGSFIHGLQLPTSHDYTPAMFSNRLSDVEYISRQYGENGVSVPSSSRWVESDKSGFLSNYCGLSGHGYLSSEARLATENNWNHARTNAKRDNTDSDCKKWLPDNSYKSSMHAQEGLAAPTKASCGTDASLSMGSKSGLTSLELSNNYPFGYFTTHLDSSQIDQVSHENEAYHSSGYLFSSATTGNKNMKHNLHVHDQHVGGFNEFHNPFTVSNLCNPYVTRKAVEIKPYVAGTSKKDHDMDKVGGIAILPKKVKLPEEMPVLDLKSNTEDCGISSTTNPDLRNTNLTVQISAQTHSSNQNSFETNDQSDSGVDSPCYKGTLAAKCSQFHIDHLPLNNSFMGDKKLKDANERSVHSVVPPITNDSVKKNNLSDFLESGVSLLKDCESSSPIKPLTRIENVNSNTLVESFLENSSSFDVAPNNGQISDLSHRVNHFDKIDGQFEICNSNENSNTCADDHFLTKSLYNLSKFACSYYFNTTKLTKEDRELLLMTVTNLETCVSKKVHISETDVYGDSIQNSSKHTCDNPDKMMPFKSSVNSDNIFDSIMDYKKNLAKEIEKSMKKVFFAEEGNSETNLYKVRWIEAEAALCSTKCELMLDKKMDEIKCFKQPSTASQLSAITEESTSKRKVVTVNSACDDALKNPFVSNALEGTCVMAKYPTQSVIPETPQCSVSPSFTASDDHACASIIFPNGQSKDQSKTYKQGIEIQESMHAGSSLNTKPVVPGIPQNQTYAGKSMLDPCLSCTLGIEVTNHEKAEYYDGEFNLVDNMAENTVRQLNFNPGNNNFLQARTVKDQNLEGYYADWEYVPKLSS